MKWFKALLITSLLSPISAGENHNLSDEHHHNHQDKKGIHTQTTRNATAEWEGAKITGSHHGEVQISEGWLKHKDGTVTEIWLQADMSSITNADVKSPEWNKKLVDHLKSDDFFGVKDHPTAELHIKEVTPVQGKQYVFVSDLTIKGITQPVVFKGKLMSMSHGMHLRAELEVDRTDYDVKYKSGSFFENLGDKLIYDEFELEFDIPFHKAKAE